MTRVGKVALVTVGAVGALVVSLLWAPYSSVTSTSNRGSFQDSVRTEVRKERHDSLPLVAPVTVDTVKRSAPPVTSPSPNALHLILPVEGIAPAQLTDTYTAARSGGRQHDAIDIMAPHNARVYAAADGTIKRFFTSVRGGITIYQLSRDSQWVYYYAHLDRYAEGLAQGQSVKQGDLLGYVGDTGDAGAGNYHLHFAIWRITDPKNFWDGQNINPYPLLRR